MNKPTPYNKKKERIYFALPNFELGGAERVIVQLATYLAEHAGIDVTIFSLTDEGPLKSSLNKRVKVIAPTQQIKNQGFTANIFRSLRLAYLVRNECKISDTPLHVISTISGMNVLFSIMKALLSSKIVLTIREAVVAENYTSALKKWLVKWSYHHSDAIIAVSYDVKDDLISEFNLNAAKITVINNPVDIVGIRKKAGIQKSLPKDSLNIVCVGRLTHQKGFDILLRALTIVQKSMQLRCTIIGDGPDRKELEALRQELSLNDVVQFIGADSNPYQHMASADMFILPSRWEGFPNVLAEAIALRIPKIIVSNCRGVPAEELAEKNIAVWFESNDAFALAKSITNYTFRNNIEECQKFVEKLSVNAIATKYLRVADLHKNQTLSPRSHE